ncbi:MAG: flagellar biosynthesis anti-sigma factor FlgM [Kangiellaceae bacterium]|jgi:negative regulator of flagellin synthesis FlgM|nr:flagellar biosynthesis anti-sigma factor FlgM [Kangiellaceae bacterium]
MAIDIRNVSSGKISTGTAKSKRVSSSAVDSDDSSESSSPIDDSVSLTSKSSQIKALIGQMMSAPVVDSSRVDPIKQKIDDGRYEIEPEQVANKMLDFEISYSRAR